MKKFFLAFALVIALTASLVAETLPVIDFSQAPYGHSTMTWPGQSTQHSGRYIVPRGGHQWGAYVVNADAGIFKMISPVGKVSSIFQPAKYTIMGDCWASAKGVAVTPFAEKWVVVWGARSFCPKRCGNVQCEPRQFPDEIQVMRLDAPGFRFIGSVRAAKTGSSEMVVIDGDFAYVKQDLKGIPPVTKWTKIDLNTLTVVATDLLSAPPKVYQTSIDGFTYSIVGVYALPWIGGFQRFRLTRSDTVIPTVPVPTVGTQTQVPTSAARTRTPTRRPPGPAPCDTIPGGPICTPTRTPSPRPTSPGFTPTPSAVPATAVPSQTPTVRSSFTPTITQGPSLTATAPPIATATPIPTPKPTGGGKGCGGAAGLAVGTGTVAAALLFQRKKATM